ncbi:helix-turn-helix transcriptional regulator [Allomesorhizobium alhagi]|uniref:LuxR family transcriptional regulator n=1 Tax=Mesorhizobium alhagi CCNWXJ12-2 TaxID=1107882 RepID=H0HVQ8_9HYPH|nr:helix-turn-helix transcriptional regulator [Mesorhizobium alhagi]EHK55180.1 LuxR family transcriptional regulator [Mesorhizobium alhagi CCNWXJ12-2]
MLHRLYEAALEPELWSSTVNAVADMIEAESTHLMVLDTTTGAEPLGLLERQDPAAHREYLDHYFADDVRVPRLTAATPGRIIRDQDVWTEEERLASPLFHEYQRAHKLYEITGAKLGLEGHLTWLGFSRNTKTPFQRDDIDFIRLLLPHFRQAVRIAVELGGHRSRTNLLGNLWSASGRAVLILTPDGRIAFANGEAEAMALRRIIRLVSNRLSFRDSALNDLLGRHLAALRGGLAPPAAVAAGLTVSPDGEQTGVRFLPLNEGHDMAGGYACLLVILTPLSLQQGPTNIEISHFASLFGLSPSEEFVLAAVSAGRDLSLHARQRGIKVDTARQQLKAVLAKTNCRTQKDLVRLVERFCFLQLR